MTKYHINQDGEPGACSARIQCRFGDTESDHYPSKEQARDAYELKMNEEMINSLQSRNAALKGKLYEAEYRHRFTMKALRKIDRDGTFKGEDFLFTKDTDSYNDSWIAKIDDTADELSVDVRFNPEKGIVFSYLDVGKNTIKLSEEKFSIDPDASDDVELTDRAIAFTKAIERAKKDHPEYFDVDKNRKINKIAEDYKNGEVTLGGHSLNRTSFAAPEIWEVRPDNIDDVQEYYIRVRHGVASLRVVKDNNKVEVVHSARLQDDHGGFTSDTEAARFFEKAETSLYSYLANK